MPLRKNIPSLQNLCLDNIARNVITHGEQFKRCKTEENIYVLYKILQSLFSCELLQSLFTIFSCENKDENLKRLEDFMLGPKDLGNPNDWPCLELLFNEYTTSVIPSWIDANILDEDLTHYGIIPYTPIKYSPLLKKMPERFLSFIISECKNLRSVNEHFCSLIRQKPNEVLAKFQNIQEVDLGVIDNTNILKKILDSCSTIKKLSSRGKSPSSDEFLFSLCKHRSQRKQFSFCPENGNCSKSGKYLESLLMPYMYTTGEGIACALQHLPRLKDFLNLPCKTTLLIPDVPDVPRGIIVLQTAAALAGREPVILELRSLYFHKSLTASESRIIFSCCPKIECLQVNLCVVSTLVFSMSSFKNLKELHLFRPTNEDLNSEHLRRILVAEGSKIKAMSFMKSLEPLDLSYIHDVLNLCCNMRKLSVWFIQISNRSYSHFRTLPGCVESLMNISMRFISKDCLPPPCRKYFRELLSNAINIKYLTVDCYFAEPEFPQVITKNSFPSLEELTLYYTDTRKIPFEKLLDSMKRLRKINFFYGFWEHGVALLKHLIRENNYELQVSHTDNSDERM